MAAQNPAKNIDDTSGFLQWTRNFKASEVGLRGGEAGVSDQVESEARADTVIDSSTIPEAESGRKGSSSSQGRDFSLAPVIGGVNLLEQERSARKMTPTQIKLMAKLNGVEPVVDPVTDLTTEDKQPATQEEDLVSITESAFANQFHADSPVQVKEMSMMLETDPNVPADKPGNIMSFFDEKIKRMPNIPSHCEQFSGAADKSKAVKYDTESASEHKPLHASEEDNPSTEEFPMLGKHRSSFSVNNLLELQEVAHESIIEQEAPLASTSLNPKAESFISGSEVDLVPPRSPSQAFPPEEPKRPIFPLSFEAERRKLTQWLRLTPAEAHAIARGNYRIRPEESASTTAKSRMVILSNLPDTNIDYKFVQRFVRGGAVESITVSRDKRCATIWFTKPEDGWNFVESHKAGIAITHNGEGRTIDVQDGKTYDAIDPVIQAYIDSGATRVLQARNIHDSTTARALYRFVKEDKVNCDFEDITDIIEGGSVRVTAFTLSSISGAVKLRTKLLATPEYWTTQDLQFLPDPCMAKFSPGFRSMVEIWFGYANARALSHPDSNGQGKKRMLELPEIRLVNKDFNCNLRKAHASDVNHRTKLDVPHEDNSRLEK